MGVAKCVRKWPFLLGIVLVCSLQLELGLCSGQRASQCGRKGKVQMTVMSFKPQNSESAVVPLPHFECYLGAEDRDASVSSSRPYRTQGGNEAQPSSPVRSTDNSLPANTAAYRVILETANNNAFGVFTCDALKDARQDTTVFTIFLRSDGYIIPSDERFTKTVSVGDIGVNINMTVVDDDVIPRDPPGSQNRDIRWRINGGNNVDRIGGGGADYQGVNYTQLSSRGITVDDEGVYEAHGKFRRNAHHVLQRLIVRSCAEGKWGPPRCIGICDNCYNGGVCDDETGRCICPPGFMGTNCLTACGGNKYGYSCEFQCDYVGTGDCIGRQFCLLDPHGCTCNTGYKNLDCMTNCEGGEYGAGCLHQCHCAGNEGRCDKFTGECESGRCQDGYSGTNCQIPDGCPTGYFGADCTVKCLCMNNVACDKITGECINGQCAPGSVKPVGSERCQECPDGFYGNNCSEECHCESDACDKATGECVGCCKPQWLNTDSNTCQTGLEGSSFPKVNSGQSTRVRCDRSQSIGNTYRTELSRERDSLVDSGVSRGSTSTGVNNQGSSISSTDFTINNVSSTDVFYCLLVRSMEPEVWLDTAFSAYELPVVNDPPTFHRRTNDAVTIRWRAWDAEKDVGDPPVVSYITYYKEEAADMWMRGSDVSPDAPTEFTASDLKMDVNYTFAVSAVRDGDGGEGPRSPPLTVKTLCDDAVVPINVQARLTDDNKVQVSWQITPGSVNCSTGITSFTVYAQIEGIGDEPIIIASVGGEMTSYIISEGLEDGVSYTFLVSSTTDQEGAQSVQSEAVQYTAPSGPSPIIFIIIIIAIVLILAIVITLVLVGIKRRRKTAPPPDREMTAYENTVSLPETPSVLDADSAGNSYEAVDRSLKSGPVKEIKVMPDNPKSARPADAVYEVTGNNSPHHSKPTPPKQAIPPPTKKKPEEQDDDFEEVLPSIGPKPSSDSEDIYANIPAPILVSSLPEYYKQNESSLGREFTLLKKDQQAPWTVSVKPENKKKNRFKKMYTYDHSRVVLEKLPNDEHSDYYNASYIPDLAGKKSFIASQAPNTASANDFWRMIWMEEVATVVMLTNLIENGKDRCFKYWPDEQGGSKVFGTIVVSWAKTSSFADFVVRKFQVSQNGVIRDVRQVHYTTWPDMDVPSEITPLMECIQHTKRLQKDRKSPVLCHCSAGVGRTGTFITLYCLIEVIKKEKKISIFEFVEKARKNRINFVQTEKQYVFLYKTLVDYYLTRHTEIPAGLLANFSIKSKRNILSDEFQLLAQVNNHQISNFGDHDNNSEKIRFRDSVPNDSGLVFLMSEGAKSLSNYINATLFRSIRQTNAFITTQSPLPNTIEDFWRLIYDWQCPIIVMLNEINLKDKWL
ncbi:Receptor-type tyrosine-protein phosphatase kappa [Holothuria leucospilota]|uniref:protein-tyrosine-phosphatase n=1 Tax=Holothuria leucospilota TaxID=206669 RepID=A0A9Q1C8H8_HOLLE|nr:Receptor-type tyrosine-protein phosphatase kappa [Holothuria leucospilota]